jgi:hypothetical protein
MIIRSPHKRTINLNKMREAQIRRHPHFEVQYMSHEMAMELSAEEYDRVYREIVENFTRRMRLRHFWTKKKFTIEVFAEYDIDFNRYRGVIRERFTPPERTIDGRRTNQATVLSAL